MSDKSEKLEFKEFFRFTKNGRMKSGTVVYSFSFALLYLVIYGAAYYFLIDALASVTQNMPVLAANIISAIVPALVGAAILSIPLLIWEGLRKPAFLGYCWVAGFALCFLISMDFQLKEDSDALKIFLGLFMSMVPASLLFGGGAAWLLYKRNKN